MNHYLQSVKGNGEQFSSQDAIFNLVDYGINGGPGTLGL